jgi:hypothetical protein
MIMKVKTLLPIISGAVIMRYAYADNHFYKGSAEDIPYKFINLEVNSIYGFVETKRKHYIVISIKNDWEHEENEILANTSRGSEDEEE